MFYDKLYLIETIFIKFIFFKIHFLGITNLIKKYLSDQSQEYEVDIYFY